MLNVRTTMTLMDFNKIRDQLELRSKVASVVKVDPFCKCCRHPIFKNYTIETCGTLTINQCSTCQEKINFIEPMVGEVMA